MRADRVLTTSTGVSLPETLWTALDGWAGEEGRTRSNLIARVLQEALVQRELERRRRA